MATYCFLARPGELFAAACMHGWLSAVLDFPHLKTEEECLAASKAVPDALRPEVCCISGDDEDAYHQLVTSAWVSTYLAHREHIDAHERAITVEKSILKAVPYDEAIDLLRPSFMSGEVRRLCDGLYEQYLAARSVQRTDNPM